MIATFSAELGGGEIGPISASQAIVVSGSSKPQSWVRQKNHGEHWEEKGKGLMEDKIQHVYQPCSSPRSPRLGFMFPFPLSQLSRRMVLAHNIFRTRERSL